MMQRLALTYLVAVTLLAMGGLAASAGETGALPPDRITQQQIASGAIAQTEIRRQGLIIFSTPFNRHDGYGDDERPTMGGNGTFLRINGLDAQSCLECHSVVRAGTMPPVLGIGGVGGSNANAIVKPTLLGSVDIGGGTNQFDGRFANPPFLFGSGGVELVGLEMTRDLQRLKQQAIATPGTPVELVSKGVHFGSLVANAAGEVDTTNVTGVKPDLVVRPFGRKGQFATVRAFDVDAMGFHFGMQPSELVGDGVDADQDGVADEIKRGDLSSLHVFATTLDRPIQDRRGRAATQGYRRFHSLGCVECHRPTLETEARRLPLRLPEVETDPRANIYYGIDLAAPAPGFDRNRAGGVSVPLFSDLRRHDMGAGLGENFHAASAEENRLFITARLWGVADTAPYLHDGRATTLTDAILAHGGEAQVVRDRFAALSEAQQDEVLAFLRTLRTPSSPAKALLAYMAQHDEAGSHADGHGKTSGKSGKKSGKSGKSSGKSRKPRRRSKRVAHQKPGTWWPKLLERLARGR